ncbi:MAG TPA: LolA-related protein [Dokdonella sp.]
MRAVASLLLAVAPCLPLPCTAAPPETASNAQAIVARLERTPPARTPYTEVRWSSLLERPLVLRGELEYLGPGKLGKRVDAPYREQLTVADGQAQVQRGEGAVRSFSLGQAPELEGFLRGFAALLGGDAAALERDFTLDASGDDAAWRLVLKPRDRRLALRIRAIEVDGADGAARCFRTRQADGDLAVLLVESLAEAKIPNRPSAPQIDALCRGDAAK